MKPSASRARALASATMLLAAPSTTPSRPPWGAGRHAADGAPRDPQAAASTLPGTSATNAPSWRGRVLIADDEYRIRLALRTCLEAEGYEVREARDGREAVDAVASGAPDVLLLDLAMPVLDGLSALRELAASGNSARPRVIVLTAYGSVSAAEMAHELGVIAFLEKPVMPEALRAAVAMALR
jgi:CheY-like chemotaxis protein